nr:MAG TPA: CASP-domain protein [Caudoviricetes sp.]
MNRIIYFIFHIFCHLFIFLLLYILLKKIKIYSIYKKK